MECYNINMPHMQGFDPSLKTLWLDLTGRREYTAANKVLAQSCQLLILLHGHKEDKQWSSKN